MKIPITRPYFDKDEERAVVQVLRSGWVTQGPKVAEFEEAVCQFTGAKYGVATTSATTALFLSLHLLEIGVGDEVIVPSFSFIATANVVIQVGAKPVFVDIESDTYNIDPKALKKAITKKTKAIIPVHIYGQSANMDEILKIAKEHKLKVVEDAAQAHGARYKEKRIGSLGDVACFSFYPTKSLGAFGDGGMIVTSDDKIYEKSMMLRDYGRKGRYEHKIKGYNSRLDTVQAVILTAKLKRLDEWNAMRAKMARAYERELKGLKGVVTPVSLSDRSHVYQTYAVRLKDRDRVCQGMQDKKIGVLIHYPIPLHLQEAYQELKYKKGDFPVAEKVSSEILSLPMFPHITEEQIHYVASTLKELV